MFSAADRDGNEARIIAAETNERGKTAGGAFGLICIGLYVYLRIWADTSN
jgi:hypothetical protein